MILNIYVCCRRKIQSSAPLVSSIYTGRRGLIKWIYLLYNADTVWIKGWSSVEYSSVCAAVMQRLTLVINGGMHRPIDVTSWLMVSDHFWWCKSRCICKCFETQCFIVTVSSRHIFIQSNLFTLSFKLVFSPSDNLSTLPIVWLLSSIAISGPLSKSFLNYNKAKQLFAKLQTVPVYVSSSAYSANEGACKTDTHTHNTWAHKTTRNIKAMHQQAKCTYNEFWCKCM